MIIRSERDGFNYEIVGGAYGIGEPVALVYSAKDSYDEKHKSNRALL